MKNKLKRIAASVLTLALLAVPVLAAAEPVGSRSLNVADGTVYTYYVWHNAKILGKLFLFSCPAAILLPIKKRRRCGPSSPSARRSTAPAP